MSNSDNIIYRFTWDLPANIENIDLNHIEFQVDQQPLRILSNTTTEILLSLSYGKHNVSIVAVDRCDQQSQATVLQLEVERTKSELSSLPLL